MLLTPLFLSKVAAKRLRTRLLRGVLGKGGITYRATYAGIGEDFETLKEYIDALPHAALRTVRKENHPSWQKAESARDCFEEWVLSQGWEFATRGFPDVLAATPNRRVLAFEGKSGTGELSPAQESMFEMLRSRGLAITVVRDVANAEMAAELKGSGWEPISVGKVTRGWPDYLLMDNSKTRMVACEFKTGPHERASIEQMKTLSALSTVLGIETHVVRAIGHETDEAWALYDDSERWLLYPPMPSTNGRVP
jgi:hypothetical protein